MRSGGILKVTLLLFAHAREAAGVGREEVDAVTVDGVLAAAVARHGEAFERVLERCRIWVNGDEPVAGGATVLQDGDEVAVLPPVSGGAA